MSDIGSTQIQKRHAERQFAGDSTVIDMAISAGCTSVDKATEGPDPIRYLKDQLPGLLFWHQPLGGGDKVPKSRRDTPIAGRSEVHLPEGRWDRDLDHPDDARSPRER